MKTLIVIIFVLSMCLLSWSALGLSGVPSMELSHASIAYFGPGSPTLLVLPDGSGRPLTDARDEAGNPVDATITMYLKDPLGIPIFNYPKEDIWLEVDDGGLARCWGYGTHLDDNTDVNGMGVFSTPLIAGGNSDSIVRVVVNGAPILSNGGFPMRFNSPDIDGSLRVDLADVSLFTIDFFGEYHFRSDFSGDGALDLADVALLAQHIGAQCP